MRNFLRRLLGLDDDLITIIKSIESANGDVQRIELIQSKLRNEASSLLQGVARIIAKLEPDYSRSEFDPALKAESDRLGQEVIDKLQAENWARRHSEGLE